MRYTSIAVPFSLDARADNHARAAHFLASKFDAWQIGTAAGELSLLFFAEGPHAEQLLREERDALSRQFDAAEQAFRLVNASRSDRIEFRSERSLPTHFTLSALSAVDLIVTQRPHAFQNPLLGPNLGDVIMQAGRPVLVVSADDVEFRPSNILIAWKDTREARRAVADALPLLKACAEVNIIEIPESEVPAAAASTSTDDLVAWLDRHDVSAGILQSAGGTSATEQIEEQAIKSSADLIIAGAYGHNRLSQWLFGGVTRYLIENSNLPVLLSH